MDEAHAIDETKCSRCKKTSSTIQNFTGLNDRVYRTCSACRVYTPRVSYFREYKLAHPERCRDMRRNRDRSIYTKAYRLKKKQERIKEASNIEALKPLF